MISKKMQAMTANSSVIRAMFEEGARLAKEYGAENVFDFSIGNPSVTPPPQVAQAICDCLEEEPPLLLHGYMNNSGYESVRAAIADHLNRQHGCALDSSHIVMTCGAAGGLNVILKTLLDPSDEVIVLAPFFGEYANYISNGARRAISDTTSTARRVCVLQSIRCVVPESICSSTIPNVFNTVYVVLEINK